MEVVVTSYCRAKYLKPTVQALLKQAGTTVIVVDGGSDAETRAWIYGHAHKCRSFADNPGADYLKNVGMEMADGPLVMLMSDDLVMPEGGVDWAVKQYRTLNARGPEGHPEWGWVACSMDYIDRNPPRPFQSVRGVDVLEVETCQVSGAIIDKRVWESLGRFPRYGRTGEGDWALSYRMRKAGYRQCYLRRPVLIHLGSGKYRDFADYSRDFDAEQRDWYQLARHDLLANNPEELISDTPIEIFE